MEQAMERSELEVIELDEELEDAFAPEKLLGVAVLGAVSSLLVYYLYQQLDSEKKHALKDNLVAAVKGQVTKWSES